MKTQNLEIPCILMRGGTSRGAYFNAADLPESRAQIADILVSIMGAGSPLQVDGVGGSHPTTSKVAILSKSQHSWAQVDYLFAQVDADRPTVDFSPNCGNILAGVGPAALEMGLVQPSHPRTQVRIHNLNTGARIEAVMETPNARVNYLGATHIDGAPDAAPVILNFQQVAGATTGAIFPTGRARDVFCQLEVSCVDVAVPMVIARAQDFGLRGDESREELDANTDLFAQMEALRIVAGEKMGLGDVRKSVTPKFALVAPPADGGGVRARYFTPWSAHPTFAVTGALCVGACVLLPDTVAARIGVASASGDQFRVEHPSGSIDVVFHYDLERGELALHSAGVVRTARKLFSGVAYAAI